MPTLDQVTAALHEIAPLHLAAEWDNVGLLVEPSKPKPIQRILLTIDLTDAVLDEAIKKKTQMIVAYHPPIFEPIKRIEWRSKLIPLIKHGIAVYSPHTALDAVPGGVNDWLLEGLGTGPRWAIQPSKADNLCPYSKIAVFVPPDHADALRKAMWEADAGHIGDYSDCSFNVEGNGTFRGNENTNPAIGKKGRLETVREVRLEMICPAFIVQNVVGAIRKAHPYEEPAIDVYPLQRVLDPELQGAGHGRQLDLDTPIPFLELVNRVKKHLRLKHVRCAISNKPLFGPKVRSIAVCAGAGGALLRKTRLLDVYLTGEMRHHDILAANADGVSVILTEHTHSERPYLPTLKKKMHEKLGRGVKIEISRADRDPLRLI